MKDHVTDCSSKAEQEATAQHTKARNSSKGWGQWCPHAAEGQGTLAVLRLHSSPALAPHPCQPSASPLPATGSVAHPYHLFPLGLPSIRTLTTHFQSRDMSWGSVHATAFPGPLTQVLREEDGNSSGRGSPL